MTDLAIITSDYDAYQAIITFLGSRAPSICIVVFYFSLLCVPYSDISSVLVFLLRSFNRGWIRNLYQKKTYSLFTGSEGLGDDFSCTERLAGRVPQTQLPDDGLGCGTQFVDWTGKYYDGASSYVYPLRDTRSAIHLLSALFLLNPNLKYSTNVK